MNSEEILNFLNEVAEVRGNAKKDLLETRKDDSSLIQVLKATYDPFITYGVKKIPVPETSGDLTFTLQKEHPVCAVNTLLKLLAERKLTGNAAQSHILLMLNLLTVSSQTLLQRILLKDLRAGFSVNTTNKVFGNIITVFDCMLAHKYETSRVKSFPVAIEPKLDGMRAICVATEKRADFFTRTGKEIPTLNHIKKYSMLLAKKAGKTIVLDGETTSGTFNESISALRKKDIQATNAIFTVFDLLSYEEWEGKKEFPLSKQRREYLYFLMRDAFQVMHGAERVFDNELGPIKLIDRKLAFSEEDIMKFYDEIVAIGGEGVIVKPLNGDYVRKRSFSWMKIKGLESHDCMVTASFEGEGKYQGMLGGLVCDFNGVDVRVGGGFSDDQRKTLWEDIHNRAHSSPIGRLVEIEAHEQTPDGSLRHPRFIRFRDDKSVEDHIAA